MSNFKKLGILGRPVAHTRRVKLTRGNTRVKTVSPKQEEEEWQSSRLNRNGGVLGG